MWTSAPRVVLPKYQKTRGKFYLYGVYELFTGRVRWRYYDHKRADSFIAFLREIRRWYPGQYILLILDQDTTHPQKCLGSRQATRPLKIHWLSLPKKSPDDNPIETIFSLLQRAILAGSDALDVRDLKRRISRFLWRAARLESQQTRRLCWAGGGLQAEYHTARPADSARPS